MILKATPSVTLFLADKKHAINSGGETEDNNKDKKEEKYQMASQQLTSTHIQSPEGHEGRWRAQLCKLLHSLFSFHSFLLPVYTYVASCIFSI